MSNYLSCLLFILISFKCFGQEQKEQKIFRFEEEFSIYITQNNTFGDNFLAKANKPKIGFGAEIVIFKIYDFGLGFGLEKGYHTVTNKAIGGNISSTNSTLANVNLIYNIKLNNTLRLDPFIGIGEFHLIQRTGKKRFGKQKGTNFGIGTNISYKLNNSISLLSGIKFNYSKLNVNTNEEFIDFFDNAQIVQLKMGLLFR
jgi:hypothetical protein